AVGGEHEPGHGGLLDRGGNGDGRRGLRRGDGHADVRAGRDEQDAGGAGARRHGGGGGRDAGCVAGERGGGGGGRRQGGGREPRRRRGPAAGRAAGGRLRGDEQLGGRVRGRRAGAEPDGVGLHELGAGVRRRVRGRGPVERRAGVARRQPLCVEGEVV